MSRPSCIVLHTLAGSEQQSLTSVINYDCSVRHIHLYVLKMPCLFWMPEHPRTETQCLSLHGKPSCGLCRINCPSSPHRILPSYCFILWRGHRNRDRSCVCIEDVCVDLERHATVIFFLKFIGTNSLPISRRALPQWGRPQLSTHAPSRRDTGTPQDLRDVAHVAWPNVSWFSSFLSLAASRPPCLIFCVFCLVTSHWKLLSDILR